MRQVTETSPWDTAMPLAGGLTAGPDGRATSAAARKIAVIGPNADDPHAQLGDWAGASGQINWMPDGHPREQTVTVLDGFRRVAPADWTITHARMRTSAAWSRTRPAPPIRTANPDRRCSNRPPRTRPC